MRVMLLSSYDRWRGGEAVFSALALELARRGHAVSLLCRRGSRLAERLGSPEAAASDAGGGSAAPQAVLGGGDTSAPAAAGAAGAAGLARAAGVRLMTARLRGEANPRSYLEVARALRDAKPEVLLTNLNRDLLFAAPGARLLGVPLVHRYARVDHPRLGGEPGAPPARRASPAPTSRPAPANPLHRALLRRWVEGCIVPSRFMRDLLLARFPGARTVAVIHNGIDVGHFRPDADAGRRWRAAHGLSANERLVGCVGALDRRHKGQHVLIAAAARARTAFRLVLVGAGPHEAELRALAAELSVDAVFTGFEPAPEAAYNAFDVAALPSRVEAFGLTLLEAMACGRPVVAAAVASIPELLRPGDEGRLVPPDDPDALAAALDGLLEDPDLCERLGAAARARAVRDFTLGRMTDRYERALEAARERRFSAPGAGPCA